MRRQTRSTSSVSGKGLDKGNEEREATTAQIKTEDVRLTEPDGSSSQLSTAVETKYEGVFSVP